MGKYAVPDHIRIMKPKGTIIKLLHNKYYVYEHFNKKDENGKWKTKSGKLLGYIDEVNGLSGILTREMPTQSISWLLYM